MYWIRLRPYTLTSAPAVTWMPLSSGVGLLLICASAGIDTDVTVPGVTENASLNVSPGIATVPVVAVPPVMNSVSSGAPL